MADRRRVAVIGGGVSGLTAAYLLRRRYDVTLFEADDRIGGRAHTHDLPTSAGTIAQVDTGFIVHNERTYPNLVRLFGELGVATRESEMAMSVRCEGCGLEYAGARGARGLFAQPTNLGSPRFLRMLGEVTGSTGTPAASCATTRVTSRCAGSSWSAAIRGTSSTTS